MATPRKIVRHEQYAALYHGTQLEQERQKCFYGSAKVDIDILHFDPSSPREVDDRNFRRLLSSFEHTGCFQFDPLYHLPAVIEEAAFRTSIAEAASSVEAVLSRDSSRWPKLSFPLGLKIVCLRGKHRIEVAKQYLFESIRWWVVDFYSENLSDDLRAYLTYQTSNELPPSAGEIYFNILRCRPSDTVAINTWWAKIQSEDEIRELKRLLKRRKLNAPFRALAKMPASGRGMLAGCIGGVLRLKCDEEIVRYLNYVYDTWSYFLGHDEAAMQRVDAHTVECLESRNPANSISDGKFLMPLLDEGLTFTAFTTSQREQIWKNIKLFRRRIPSIRTFFQDVKYLEMLVDCVKKLVQPLRRETVFQALARCFGASSQQQINELHGQAGELDFEVSYRKLYLFVMRHLESLRPGSILLERGERRKTLEKDAQMWYDFAQEADRLGFTSPSIIDVLSKNPDRIAARAALLHARNPEAFQYNEEEFELLIDQMVTLFSKARRIDRIEETPSLLCNGGGEEIGRRSGRPFRKAQEEVATFLTFHNMHIADANEVGELTPFFVRRDVYLSFFGHPLQVDSQLDCPSVQQLPHEPRATRLSHLDQAQTLPLDAGNSGHLGENEQPAAETSGLQDSDHQSLEGDSLTSPSRYSQSLREQSHTDSTEGIGTVQQDRETLSIKFISHSRDQPEVFEETVYVDTADAAVEEIAGRYASRGLFLFDRRLRSIAPPQCLAAALEDESHAIVLIPEGVNMASAESMLRTSSLKRLASEELISTRPRKFHVV